MIFSLRGRVFGAGGGNPNFIDLLSKKNRKSVIMDVKCVAMARYGLILKEMEATASRKVAGPSPVHKTLLFDPKTENNVMFVFRNFEFSEFPYITPDMPP